MTVPAARKADDLEPASSPTAKRRKTSASAAAITPSQQLARKILLDTFDYPSFRSVQEAVVTRLLDGESACCIWPTGAGKSIAFQIPAIGFEKMDALNGVTGAPGVTLVVSPLIALMREQVETLKKKGVCAAALDSSQTREQYLETNKNFREGRLKLLYCAPERLNNEAFVASIKDVRIRLLAVDESHCISEWGHSFRPDYLKIARFAKEIEAERVLCLTATATEKVAKDIMDQFEIPAEGLFRTPTYRENLQLLAKTATSESEKFSILRKHLQDNPGPSIIYVTIQKETEQLSQQLTREGFPSRHYHAGMATNVRQEVQDAFMASPSLIVVATIAFGMGIDKPNIRSVVHYNPPKSLEAYSQEVGRAGRDGLPSSCLLILRKDDFFQIESFSRADVPSEKSVVGWMKELLQENSDAQEGDVIEAKLYEQCNAWDIRQNTLNILYAQLELRFGLLRAITPMYSKNDFAKTPTFSSIVATDDISRHLLSTAAAQNRKKWVSIDIDTVARMVGAEREKVVRKLAEWNDAGLIESKPGGVVSRYRILKSLPEDVTALAKDLYREVEAREAENMARIHSVVTLFTTPACYARSLATHFEPVPSSPPASGCTKCGFCTTGKEVDFVLNGEEQRELTQAEKKSMKDIVAEVNDTGDVRYLARIGWGISSPRATKAKLSQKKIWGSLMDVSFDRLVREFEKDGGRKVERLL